MCQLDVNYALPGFARLLLKSMTLIPMEIVDNTPVKEQGVEKLYLRFTLDESGKFNGKMNIPTSVDIGVGDYQGVCH